MSARWQYTFGGDGAFVFTASETSFHRSGEKLRANGNGAFPIEFRSATEGRELSETENTDSRNLRGKEAES